MNSRVEQSYDIDKINRLFRGLTPRRIFILARLAGLNEEEIRIMRMKWLEGKSDVQICDIMGYSASTLTRKRRNGHLKILDAFDLYGLSHLDELRIDKVFEEGSLYYKAQDLLILFFLRNNMNGERQQELVDYLTKLDNDGILT